MKHTGAGDFDFNWIPVGQADDEAGDTVEGNRGDITPQSLSDKLTPTLSGSTEKNMLGKLMKDDTGHTILSGGTLPSSPITSAEAEREKLATECIQVIGARKFEVAVIGAGALIAAYGCRQACNAVCWLLQLQRYNGLL